MIDGSSSQVSSASSASTTGSSASSSTLSDRSLRRRARGALNAIRILWAEGDRRLFQRSEMIGVLGRNGWTPCSAACGDNDMEVEVEAVSSCVGQPATSRICVLDSFLCSQQQSDVSPYKKHQVRNRSWHFLRDPIHVVHALWNVQHPSHRMALSTFYKQLKYLPWIKSCIKATTATAMVCACPYHVGFRWLLTARDKMVAQANGDNGMEPLTRKTCLRVCGGCLPLEPSEPQTLEGKDWYRLVFKTIV